ncbi:winged helix-turn-helix domain-containing protein [Enterococcus sp. HY326]|uniref:winged helix-turn-helix domain-containing protein n=1 Tax=Enterococcus sp. HY326 TaxID=2971265 RepID=UPI002240BFC8|nr:helix-turn-helix domain-containing protein [Enterococcus sp. HY326]
MEPIVILTNNPAQESNLEKKLRFLGYEVFCSALLLKKGPECEELYSNFFKIVMLSETIADYDARQFLAYLPKDIAVYRVTDNLEIDGSFLYEDGIQEFNDSKIVSAQMTIAELREILVSGKRSSQQNGAGVTAIEDFKAKMSITENRLFDLLEEAEGKILTRDQICFGIWQEPANTSRKTQISQLVSKIRLKMENAGFDGQALKVIWRKGYCLQQNWLDAS